MSKLAAILKFVTFNSNLLSKPLSKASLYGLLAKRFEYVDPQKHMHYYQKHFYYTMKVEQHCMMLQDSNGHHHTMSGQFPM
jgi:hypothetical protein